MVKERFTRRRVLLAGLVVLVVVAVSAYWWLAAAGPRLRVENYPQVRVGMTQGEVEQLLGGPPGYYGRYPRGGGAMRSLEEYEAPPGSLPRFWWDDDHRFELYFDNQGRLVGQHQRAIYIQQRPESFFTRFWRSLPRRLGL